MMIPRKSKVAIGQAGGPTAVINASLIGFIAEAMKNFQVFGIINALQGLVENWFVEIDDLTFREVSGYRDVPGAFLGSGRWFMNESDFERSIEQLKKSDIHLLVLIGGNGTMWSCREMEKTALAMGYELSVIGIPKTVDNDLLETDHSPGFASVARYVALSVRDIGKDLQAMRNFESVRIIETMGRNVGWLAAASMLLKESKEQPPHLIYTPERPFNLQKYLSDVSDVVNSIGYATVVISEGIRDENGSVLSRLALQRDMGNKVLGGASKYLASQVSKELKLAARAEMLGMNQRCSQLAVSLQDRIEAEALGRAAAAYLRKGISGVMLTLLREHDEMGQYRFRIGNCLFESVAGLERELPDEFLTEAVTSVNGEFKIWLRSIVGDDIQGYPDWTCNIKE